MQTRVRTFLAIAMPAALLVAGTMPAAANFINGPASAGIVERFEEPGIGFVADVEDDLLLIANANSVADVCDFNPAGAGEVQSVNLPGGVVVNLLHDRDLPLLLIPLPPDDSVCDDPDAWPVIAVGRGDVIANDNDINVSFSRTNSFGFKINGSVVDDAGDTWNVRGHFQARINKNDEFVANEGIKLARRGGKN